MSENTGKTGKFENYQGDYKAYLITDKRSKLFGRLEFIDLELIKLCTGFEAKLRTRQKLSNARQEQEAKRLKTSKKARSNRLKRLNPKEHRRRVENMRRIALEKWKDHTPKPKAPKLTKRQISELRRDIAQRYWDIHKSSEYAEEIVNQVMNDILGQHDNSS